MATLFPDIAKERVVFSSYAEEAFYLACKDQLPDDWLVYHSCTLSRLEENKGLVDNEIDFVLYHRKWGLLALEVKGGQITFNEESSSFYSKNRFGKSFRIKNPFLQVLTWKSRFLRFLKDRKLKVPLSHAVVFPQASEDEFPETSEIEPKLIIGIGRMKDLHASIIEIIKLSQPVKYLNFADVSAELKSVLKGTKFATKLHLREYIDGHEARLKDVEGISETLVHPLAALKRVGIEGEAGTGKTLLAVKLAEHFRALSKSVLLLSSNPLLNNQLKEYFTSGVVVQTYSEFSSSYGVEILRRPATYKGKREDWVQLDGPSLLGDKILASKNRYDVFLCDEGQDVQPFWWDAIEKAVSDEGHFYIFFDRSQGVFGSLNKENEFVPEKVLPVPDPYFSLLNNYRTTSEIAQFSRPFRTGKRILEGHASRLGFKPEVITYKDAADFKMKCDKLVEHLTQNEGVYFDEITLLSGRALYNEGSVLCGKEGRLSYDICNLGTEKNRTIPDRKQLGNRLKASTIRSFKGLETAVGVVINMSEHGLSMANPIMSSLFYVAATRAKHMLYVFIRQDSDKLAPMRKALEGVVVSGALRRLREDDNHELLGKLAYFNPERFGCLVVETLGEGAAGGVKEPIMFLPSDAAHIKNLRVGQRLRFRVRLEGGIKVALDLDALEEGVG